MLAKAIEFAVKYHDGQLDDDGLDYFDAHVNQVINILYSVTHDDDILSAAALHDIIEDTNITLEVLEHEFNSHIANLVFQVTHVGNKQDGYSFPNLKDQEAIMIKFADRLSNISRMESWSNKRKAQYLKQSQFWRV
jgi:(p)ppGpp synthase/HD superfamily hydrolase